MLHIPNSSHIVERCPFQKASAGMVTASASREAAKNQEVSAENPKRTTAGIPSALTIMGQLPHRQTLLLWLALLVDQT